jgi:hypothetical protein
MNCLEFRRVHLTDPGTQEPEFLHHQRACERCARLATRSVRFEQNLSEALKVKAPEDLSAHILLRQSFQAFPNQPFELSLKKAMKIAVPEDLSSRVLLRQSFLARRGRPFWRNRLYALAASVLLAVGLLGGLLLPEGAPTLEEAVFAHILSEPHYQTGTEQVQREALASLLAPVGAEVKSDLGQVTAASICAIRERIAAHLVLAGEKTPVAVLLMPSEQVEERSYIKRGKLRGILAPVHEGSMAIVGDAGETLEPIETRIRSALRWRL